jgi:D-sedoheptulose 7-phosphate isomerase
MKTDDYISSFLDDAISIINRIDRAEIKNMTRILQDTRTTGGRLFILGVGGGAGHASHAVNDFRKIAGIESYAPTDNVSELTARVNDDGWETVFENWLRGSRLTPKDCVFVFSVGGGNAEKKVSVTLVNALRFAKETGARVIGIVGRDGGYTAKVADACIVIPTMNEKTITPQTEAFQAIVWHLIVSSPSLQKFEMKWESTK